MLYTNFIKNLNLGEYEDIELIVVYELIITYTGIACEESNHDHWLKVENTVDFQVLAQVQGEETEKIL